MMEKMMYRLNPTAPVNQLTANFIMNPQPLTLYSILNSIANYDSEVKTKIRDLAKVTHKEIFDFDYVLSDKLNKDQFEIDILNHFLERRIGYDTITSFQIHLETKLHEILPYYNTLFDALSDYKLFNDGEKIERHLDNSRSIDTESATNTKGNVIDDRKYSKYPQNQLDDVMDGNYVTDQNYNTNDLTNNTDMNSNSNESNIENEVITRSPTDKMKLYESYLKTKDSIMTRLYKDLDVLFYQLVD